MTLKTLPIRETDNSCSRQLLKYTLKFISTHTRRTINQVSFFYGDSVIKSSEGTQQGDPESPASFSDSIQDFIDSLPSKINLWYLDDVNLSDDYRTVLENHKQFLLQKSCWDSKLNAKNMNYSPWWHHWKTTVDNFSIFPKKVWQNHTRLAFQSVYRELRRNVESGILDSGPGFRVRVRFFGYSRILGLSDQFRVSKKFGFGFRVAKLPVRVSRSVCLLSRSVFFLILIFVFRIFICNSVGYSYIMFVAVKLSVFRYHERSVATHWNQKRITEGGRRVLSAS